MTTHLASPRSSHLVTAPTLHVRAVGMIWLVLAELFAGLVGFAVVVRLARVLGPEGFSHLEYASAVAAWLLVLVRGGLEIIVYREAARHPPLIASLSALLVVLRLAWAGIGLLCVAGLALTVSPARGMAVLLTGLTLLPSALVLDVGLRTRGRFGAMAILQVMRVAAYAGGVFAIVLRPEHVNRAAFCLVAAEGLSALAYAMLHLLEHGLRVPRISRRAACVFTAKGLVASVIRFTRVTLYGSDLLVLGWLAGAELGPYAAARRMVFALVGLGLVVPSALGPLIARAWIGDPARTAKLVGRASATLWSMALPAAVGLALIAMRGMPAIYGSDYRSGALWLVLIAARLPWLLEASLCQSVLIACRRERLALRLVLVMAAATAAALPVAGGLLGLWGVALVSACVELCGALVGWRMLRSLGAAPAWWQGKAPAVCGCLAMPAACRLVWNAPLAVVIAAGAAAYAAAWSLAFAWPPRRPSQRGRLAWRLL